MEKVPSGKVCEIKQKLIEAVSKRFSIKNELSVDIGFEVEEVLDGSKPKLTISIKRVFRRWTNPFISYGWSKFWMKITMRR
jgi:hypothetical protein